MGKKKTAPKMAATSAPTASLQDFEAEIAKALDIERTRVKQKLASEVWSIREYQNDTYKEIMKRGHAEGFGRAQDDYTGMLQQKIGVTFERGRKGS